MKGPLPETQMFIKAARVIEGFNKLTETTVDFMSPDKKLDLGKVVGKSITIRVKTGDDDSTDWREFVGTCVEGEYIGIHEGYGYYSLQVRPWLWFLTKARNNRIFQKMNAMDIIKKVLEGYRFSDFTVKLNRTPEQRVYTVQYDETDYDFVSRLMEEEGIYFFSSVKNGLDHLMIVDDIGAHSPVAGTSEIGFFLREKTFRRSQDHVFEWRGAEVVTSGKVTLSDWNFERPKADLKTAKAAPKGKHGHKDYEIYRYPGHYRETALGDVYARVEMEANAAEFQTRYGVGNVRTLATGATFKLKEHFREDENQEYLITSGIHMMQIETAYVDESQEVADRDSIPHTIEFEAENEDFYRCTFSALPKNTPFRAKRKTPWPRIPGILIARVTGPKGEEIYTDNYGRIKVQFPWDRDGKNDENTTCWVRVTTPWSGKNWGMVHIPRIEQEVVIQFEDGDPDRPICTGMLYNADTMPPYGLPDNMTQSGIKTNSSKGGGGFNELMMEDKKDEELVRLQSEKDYVEIIKNNATITIGIEKRDPGDLKQTIYANKTETIQTGDMTFTVEKGNEKRHIETDQTQTIGGNQTEKVKGDVAVTVKGKQVHETTGSHSSTATGEITIESKQKIVLKVGTNTLTIDPSGITLEGTMITTTANGMAKHTSNGMMVISGSMTMIN
ncbi:type VI secretion system Vgr family protein [Pseudorhodobacter sp.]|uniref:type VI secretion system Vgr family protein n=1 Tax=Pseudorhodobacter sp. TaxID=1934400 RepID=UPI00264944E9|nr:type VI secretion system tip protein TssI/VgrG [Pseudorhodobacter sp.]MDN5787843.1 type VI secretion system tip protein VgrG [Pseudorhodobacter sp.]